MQLVSFEFNELMGPIFWIRFKKKKFGFCFCHRIKERTIPFFGLEKILCSRCLGIFIGFIASVGIYIVGIKLLNIFILVFFFPLIFDGFSQALSLRKSNNTIRFITGFLFGIALGGNMASMSRGEQDTKICWGCAGIIGIIVFIYIIDTTFGIWGFVFLGFVIFLAVMFYLYHMNQERKRAIDRIEIEDKVAQERIIKENENKIQKRKSFENNIDLLNKNGDNVLIENYVKKYYQNSDFKDFIQEFLKRTQGNIFNGSTEINEFINIRRYEWGLNDLFELISFKGYHFDYYELILLISAYYFNLSKDEYKKKIEFNNAIKLEDYIDNFLIHYPDYSYKDLNDFTAFLKEKDITINTDDLHAAIKKIKYSRLETELLKNDNKITLDDIDDLDGYQFETFLVNLFEKMGYRVEHTALSGDQGADLILFGKDEKVVVQAKCYFNQPVTNKAIQEVTASIKHYEANRGMVVTNSQFTSSAVELANSNSIELIHREKLGEWIRRYL